MIFIKLNKEKELINRNGESSSMRFAMLTILELIVLAVIVMLLIFVYQAIFCDDVSFESAGYFLGGLAALFGVTVGAKSIQKKHEL